MFYFICNVNEKDRSQACVALVFTVNGQWGSWQAWNACSVSCKGGVQRRKRSCNNPSPAHGGTDCVGVSMVTQSCNLKPCPGIAISKFINRTNETASKWGNEVRSKKGTNYMDYVCVIIVVIAIYAVNGGWSPWNNWSSCQRTCGGGTQLRYRTCTHPLPQHHGEPCRGQGSMSRSCNTFSCPRGMLDFLFRSVHLRRSGKADAEKFPLERFILWLQTLQPCLRLRSFFRTEMRNDEHLATLFTETHAKLLCFQSICEKNSASTLL